MPARNRCYSINYIINNRNSRCRWYSHFGDCRESEENPCVHEDDDDELVDELAPNRLIKLICIHTRPRKSTPVLFSSAIITNVEPRYGKLHQFYQQKSEYVIVENGK